VKGRELSPARHCRILKRFARSQLTREIRVQQREADIEKLDLRNNSIPASSAPHLASVISKKPLNELNLNMNELGASAEGIKALAKALKDNTALESLSIGGNSISGEGAGTLMAALQGNTVLRNLDMGCAIVCMYTWSSWSCLHVSHAQSDFFLFFLVILVNWHHVKFKLSPFKCSNSGQRDALSRRFHHEAQLILWPDLLCSSQEPNEMYSCLNTRRAAFSNSQLESSRKEEEVLHSFLTTVSISGSASSHSNISMMLCLQIQSVGPRRC
jgi:hypothetical protein